MMFIMLYFQNFEISIKMVKILKQGDIVFDIAFLFMMERFEILDFRFEILNPLPLQLLHRPFCLFGKLPRHFNV